MVQAHPDGGFHAPAFVPAFFFRHGGMDGQGDGTVAFQGVNGLRLKEDADGRQRKRNAEA